MSKLKKRFDPTFVAGLLLAVFSILGGLLLEKGHVEDVTQVTAALIVFGGTIGAVVVATPKSALLSAVKRAPSVLWSTTEDPAVLLERLVTYSLAVRKGERPRSNRSWKTFRNAFLRKA